MTQPTGIHHIAVMSADIKPHIAFFSEVLGCPLVGLFGMHGVEGGLHAFLRLNDYCYFSIVQLPGAADAKIVLGQTHAGSGAAASAPGTLQHLAFNVDTENALLGMRDRIRSHGVNVFGPIDHGMCKSIYFGGPDHMTLEVATSPAPLDAELWIDPATLNAAGIDATEAHRYRAPIGYSGPSPVQQPPYDPAMPHESMPMARYLQLLATPDEIVSAHASYPDPPVKPRARRQGMPIARR